MITRMLKPKYSERGSSDRVKEETTFMLFLDLLHECEGMVIHNFHDIVIAQGQCYWYGQYGMAVPVL